MIPQGSTLVNVAQFQAMIDRVNAIDSCASLQAFATEALSSVSAVTAAIGQELDAVKPILALLTAPSANPSAIVTWLETFITCFLTPYTRPVVTYAAQLTEIAIQVGKLEQAIADKASRLPSCSIALPT